MRSVHVRRSSSRVAAFVLCLLLCLTGVWGCNRPTGGESARQPASAEPASVVPVAPEPAESIPSPSDQPAPPAEPPTDDSPAVDEPAANAWDVGPEWNEKLSPEPADFGTYGMRVPVGFEESARGTDSPTSKQPYLVAYQSPTVEGATPAIITAMFNSPQPAGEEYPERDAMLAAYFANVTTRWPDSQRGKTEEGSVGGLPASRMFYEAKLPNEQVIKGVVYLIDHGAQRIVLQGGANNTAPDYPLELIDAAMRTFAKKALQ